MWLIGMKRLSQMHWTGHIPWRIVQSIIMRRKTAFLLLLSASFAFAAPKELLVNGHILFPLWMPPDGNLRQGSVTACELCLCFVVWSSHNYVWFLVRRHFNTPSWELTVAWLLQCNCLLETKSGIHCPFIALISLSNLLMRLLGLLPHMLLLQLVVRPWVSHSNYNLISSLDADHLNLFTSTWRSELAF